MSVLLNRATGKLIVANQIFVYGVNADDSFTEIANLGYLNRSMDICANGVIWIAGTEKLVRLTPSGAYTFFGKDESGTYPAPPPYDGPIANFHIKWQATGVAVTKDGRSIYYCDAGKVKRLNNGIVYTVAEIGPELIDNMYVNNSKIALSSSEKQLYCIGDVYGGELLTVNLP